MTKLEKKVVTVAVVGSLLYGTGIFATKAVTFVGDNFLYLPSVESVNTGVGGVEVVTSSGSTYWIEGGLR